MYLKLLFLRKVNYSLFYNNAMKKFLKCPEIEFIQNKNKEKEKIKAFSVLKFHSTCQVHICFWRLL